MSSESVRKWEVWPCLVSLLSISLLQSRVSAFFFTGVYRRLVFIAGERRRERVIKPLDRSSGHGCLCNRSSLVILGFTTGRNSRNLCNPFQWMIDEWQPSENIRRLWSFAVGKRMVGTRKLDSNLAASLHLPASRFEPRVPFYRWYAVGVLACRFTLEFYLSRLFAARRLHVLPTRFFARLSD